MHKGFKLRLSTGETVEIRSRLGSGGYGAVYRGQIVGKKGPGGVVAVKTLPPWAAAGDDERASLTNEIERMRDIDHPNVVHLLDWIENTEHEGPILVTEFVAQGDLRKDLNRRRQVRDLFPVDVGLRMCSEIASGLHYLNVIQGLVHRDIKPENLLLAGEGVKIADLGIAKVRDDATRRHTFKHAGSVEYEAPERREPGADLGGVDLYAAGLVFHEILTLAHPLRSAVKDADDSLAWIRAHREATRPALGEIRKDVPAAIARMLDAMISCDPSERPEWAQVLTALRSHAGPGGGSGTGPGRFDHLVSLARDARDRDQRAADADARAHADAVAFRDPLVAQVRARVQGWVAEFNASAPDDLRILASPPSDAASDGLLSCELPSRQRMTCTVFAAIYPPLRVSDDAGVFDVRVAATIAIEGRDQPSLTLAVLEATSGGRDGPVLAGLAQKSMVVESLDGWSEKSLLARRDSQIRAAASGAIAPRDPGRVLPVVHRDIDALFGAFLERVFRPPSDPLR